MTDKDYIITALKITIDDYTQAVEAGGIDWIRKYFGDDQSVVDVFTKNAEFWVWWVNQWEIRDREFIRVTGIDLIAEPLEGKVWYVAFQEYLEVHDVSRLSIIPNRFVLQKLASELRIVIFRQEDLLNQHTHEK